MKDLVLCSSCTRHVRRVEERCPFCGTPVAAETRAARPPVAPAGLSRAKLYAFHAAVVTGVAAGACGGTTSPLGDGGSAVDARSNDAVAADGESTGDAANGMDTGVDAAADSSMTADAADAGVDRAIADTGTDGDGWGPPPPPYGCVFPEGCGDVKV
jgi:hypothetical protein